MKLRVIEYDQGGGIRDATDAEVMAAARVIVDRRMDGDMSMFVSSSLDSLHKGFEWCDENGFPTAVIYVQFDGHWNVP